MVRYEDHCVDCPAGMPCFGKSCPLVNVPVYYCDKCGEETPREDIRRMGEGDICIDCFFKMVGESHPNPYALFKKLNDIEE